MRSGSVKTTILQKKEGNSNLNKERGVKKNHFFRNNLLSFKSINIKPLTKQFSVILQDEPGLMSETQGSSAHLPGYNGGPGERGQHKKDQGISDVKELVNEHHLKNKLHGKDTK